MKPSKQSVSSKKDDGTAAEFSEFCNEFEPLEPAASLLLLIDNRTGARYCECHIKASKIVELTTTDVPLDPDEPEYRANREIVTNAPAFAKMQADALARRSFSNIVGEYTKEVDEAHPLKIIGGQHRIEAIRKAYEDSGVDEHHGMKIYFGLNMDQRLDVQLISNTNIAISGDLYDRMQETVMGPELRNWAQSVGLLEVGSDFADRRVRGGPISVQMARTFVTSYYAGKAIDVKKFETTETTPTLCPSGQIDDAWEKLRDGKHDIWKDKELKRAATEYSKLIDAQRGAFKTSKPKPKPDYPEKATNPAILAAWAYIAGMLHNNAVRLDRHYALSQAVGKDPLNASSLAAGRHKTDPDNYRGLGYRTDSKERGRLVELFFLQAENGKGISKVGIDAAIAQFHAKQAVLEAQKAKAKVSSG